MPEVLTHFWTRVVPPVLGFVRGLADVLGLVLSLAGDLSSAHELHQFTLDQVGFPQFTLDLLQLVLDVVGDLPESPGDQVLTFPGW